LEEFLQNNILYPLKYLVFSNLSTALSEAKRLPVLLLTITTSVSVEQSFTAWNMV
jgi:hypothetical protein